MNEEGVDTARFNNTEINRVLDTVAPRSIERIPLAPFDTTRLLT